MTMSKHTRKDHTSSEVGNIVKDTLSSIADTMGGSYSTKTSDDGTNHTYIRLSEGDKSHTSIHEKKEGGVVITSRQDKK
jgi:hypothetical protein